LRIQNLKRGLLPARLHLPSRLLLLRANRPKRQLPQPSPSQSLRSPPPETT
jgi:hypothetical protein